MDPAPADHTARDVTLARLPSGREITTRLHRYDGAEGGPTVYLQAAQHGIELNGPAVLRRIHRHLTTTPIAGTVLVVPVANPLAFDHRSYMAPAELDAFNPNMNRVWPGSADGTLQEQMAATLWEHVVDADALVDLHTGMPDMLEHVIYMEGNETSRRLAERFGIDLLVEEEIDDDDETEWTERDFHAKLRNTATRAGIPAITPELGNSRHIERGPVERGEDGVVNVLKTLDVLADDPDSPAEFSVARNHVGRVGVDHSGLFEATPNLTVGDPVTDGDYLGEIYSPATFETLEEVRANRDGILYSLRREATVVAGESVANVAIPFE